MNPEPALKEGNPPGAEDGVDVPAGGLPFVTLVKFELDPGIGGKDSNSDAPKDDVGLNGLSPPNPVICGLSVGDNDTDGVPEAVVVLVG